MGKITCEKCKKSCRGQAIKLSEKYYHVKCFKCKECKKQLAAGGFYTKDENYYCAEDYQKLFGTKCHSCGKFVEGEVVTALGNTYHQSCFACTKCNTKFGPGDKVTFTGNDYLCNVCLDAVPSSASTPMAQTPGGTAISPKKGEVLPAATSTPARPGEIIMDGHLGSPMSDMSEITPDNNKENVSNGPHSGGMSPQPGGLDTSPLTPLSISTSGYKSDSEVMQHSGNVGYKDRLSPVQNLHNIMQYRSPSPAASTVSRSSRKSRESTGSCGSRPEVDYGKFYKTSYLDKPHQSYNKGPSINPNDKLKSPHFHRPDNFSYSQVRKDFFRPVKKDSSMISALGDTNYVITSKKVSGPAVPLLGEDAIRNAKFPDAHKPSKMETSRIERDDWPAPPDPAAAYPELLRAHKPGHYRRKSEDKIDGKESDHEAEENGGDWEEDEDEDMSPVDPKIEKEIEELEKIPDSGAAKVILKELEKKKKEVPTVDPRSASRTPSAAHEPAYKTRYESPIFASPSRDLEFRPRLLSMDDQLIGIKYRTPSLPISNYPVPKPGYGRSPKSTTLPVSSRNGDAEFDRTHDREYMSLTDVEEVYDPHTGLRRNTRLRGSTISEGLHEPSYLVYRKSIPSLFASRVEPPKNYEYEQLKITNFSLPPDVDRNTLETHLTEADFENIFQMRRDDFYRLAEWKRNDIKRRADLF